MYYWEVGTLPARPLLTVVEYVVGSQRGLRLIEAESSRARARARLHEQQLARRRGTVQYSKISEYVILEFPRRCRCQVETPLGLGLYGIPLGIRGEGRIFCCRKELAQAARGLDKSAKKIEI